jgi:hypothetical protein
MKRTDILGHSHFQRKLFSSSVICMAVIIDYSEHTNSVEPVETDVHDIKDRLFGRCPSASCKSSFLFSTCHRCLSFALIESFNACI